MRPGVCTYGMHPSDHVRLWEGMEPVMSWTSRVALIRNVPPGATIGYGMTHTVRPEGAVIATVSAVVVGVASRVVVDVRGSQFVFP